jgi:D-alanyl-D-alanine carboxypeptidase (penicillin-binding protein 5/6)
MMKPGILLWSVLFLLAGVSPSRAVPFDTPATHAIIVDVNTGTVLLDKNADVHMPTSSMSKTMTLYMVFEALKQGHLKLDDELPVSEKAWKMEGSKMFIRVGSKVRVEDLIRGVAIQSGNDATVALAEGLAGTEEAFVERMNVRAKELGMANSHFMDASGWPAPDHYSTPRDLALLAQDLMTDFPEYYHYFGEKDFTYNKIHQPNRDPLLGKVAGADGVKTGHTDIAGYGLIGSAQRDGRRLVLVINGLPSEQARAEEGAKLMEWGFRNFENKEVFKAGDQVATAKVWLGQEEEVPLVAEKDLTVVLPLARRADIKMTVTYPEPLPSPLKKGSPVAKLHILIPDQPPQEVALLAGSDVARKGIFGRVAARCRYLMTGIY